MNISYAQLCKLCTAIRNKAVNIICDTESKGFFIQQNNYFKKVYL